MSIDTRFTPAIRNALLEQMQDLSGRFSPDGGERPADEAVRNRSIGTDSVNLSAEALQIHASINTTAGQDVFDVERVAELRHAIGSGTYNIDALRVADKFHRFNQSL
ncbi:MAG: flagellar biosynthesis anti-sigma factor FlgM [Gammaproteobacteria bacterium]|nr:flagellar biosynthesis anti-sigma factor FlgM [Gammaproteobacteria bacterium]